MMTTKLPEPSVLVPTGTNVAGKMRTALFALACSVLWILSACSKPPEDAVLAIIRQDIERKTMLASLYGGDGTKLGKITIGKVTERKYNNAPSLFIYEYSAEFNYVAKVLGEKSGVQTITGRVGVQKRGDKWASEYISPFE